MSAGINTTLPAFTTLRFLSEPAYPPERVDQPSQISVFSCDKKKSDIIVFMWQEKVRYHCFHVARKNTTKTLNEFVLFYVMYLMLCYVNTIRLTHR